MPMNTTFSPLDGIWEPFPASLAPHTYCSMLVPCDKSDVSFQSQEPCRDLFVNESLLWLKSSDGTIYNNYVLIKRGPPLRSWNEFLNEALRACSLNLLLWGWYIFSSVLKCEEDPSESSLFRSAKKRTIQKISFQQTAYVMFCLCVRRLVFRKQFHKIIQLYSLFFKKLNFSHYWKKKQQGSFFIICQLTAVYQPTQHLH